MFNYTGNEVRLSGNTSKLSEVLVPAVYSLNDNIFGMYLVKKFDKFDIPDELFSFNSNTPIQNHDIFANAFTQLSNNGKNLGVLLSGLKGTGKTLLAKQTANRVLNSGIPVILVERSFNSSQLAVFLNDISSRAMIIFDEFEKNFTSTGENVYNDNIAVSVSGNKVSSDEISQEKLLSLLDGTANIKYPKLYMFTCNNMYGISTFMINRPSRVRYHIKFGALSSEFILNFLKTKLFNKDDIELINTIMTKLSLIEDINFDMLNEITNEINFMHPTLSIEEIFNIMNISTLNNRNVYDITLIDEETNTIISSDKNTYINPNLDKFDLYGLRVSNISNLKSIINDDSLDYENVSNELCSITVNREDFNITSNGMYSYLYVKSLNNRKMKIVFSIVKKYKTFNSF